MRKHHAFRFARGARSVNNCRQIIRAHGAQKLVERARLIAIMMGAAFFQFLQGDRVPDVRRCFFIKENQLQRHGQALERFGRVLENLAPGDKEGARAGIAQDEGNLIDGLRGVDRNIDGAQRKDRQVGDGPLRPVFRKEGHTIAGLDAQIGKTERHVPHARDKRCRRYVDPLAVDFMI